MKSIAAVGVVVVAPVCPLAHGAPALAAASQGRPRVNLCAPPDGYSRFLRLSKDRMVRRHEK